MRARTNRSPDIVDTLFAVRAELYDIACSVKAFTSDLARLKNLLEEISDCLEICPICCRPAGAASQAPCGHVFCRSCILRWIVDHDKNTCPTCRAPIELEDVVETRPNDDQSHERRRRRRLRIQQAQAQHSTAPRTYLRSSSRRSRDRLSSPRRRASSSPGSIRRQMLLDSRPPTPGVSTRVKPNTMYQKRDSFCRQARQDGLS